MKLPDAWVSAFVRGVLEGRQARNRSYSLRALARDLKIDPSALSKILRGKRYWTVRQKAQLSHKLGALGIPTESVEQEFLKLDIEITERLKRAGALGISRRRWS